MHCYYYFLQVSLDLFTIFCFERSMISTQNLFLFTGPFLFSQQYTISMQYTYYIILSCCFERKIRRHERIRYCIVIIKAILPFLSFVYSFLLTFSLLLIIISLLITLVPFNAPIGCTCNKTCWL